MSHLERLCAELCLYDMVVHDEPNPLMEDLRRLIADYHFVLTCIEEMNRTKEVAAETFGGAEDSDIKAARIDWKQKFESLTAVVRDIRELLTSLLHEESIRSEKIHSSYKLLHEMLDKIRE